MSHQSGKIILTQRQRQLYMNHVLQVAKNLLIEHGQRTLRNIEKEAEAR